MTLLQFFAALVLGGVCCRMASLPRPGWSRIAIDWAAWVVAHSLIGAGALVVMFGRTDAAVTPILAGLAVYFALRWSRRSVR